MSAFKTTKLLSANASAILAFCFIVLALTFAAADSTADSSANSAPVDSLSRAQSGELNDSPAQTPVVSTPTFLRSRLAEPLGDVTKSLTVGSGDFDGDGVIDLVIGHLQQSSFALSLYRGNAVGGTRQKPNADSTESVSFYPEGLFALPEAPEFLATGDFNGDGNIDAAVAARSSNRLYLLAGNGRGWFEPARSIELSGRITAMSGRDVDDPSGLAHLAVGIVMESGSAVMLFESAGGVFAPPSVLRLKTEPTAILFKRSDGSNPPDLVVGAGTELLFALGRDRQVASSGSDGSELSWSSGYGRSFESAIRSIVAGDFSRVYNAPLALLTADGSIYQLTSGFESPLESDYEIVRLGNWPTATSLLRGRVSGSQADDLMVVDPGSRSLRVMAEGEAPELVSGPQELATGRVNAAIDLEGEALSVLPIRLNTDALSDFVFVKAGQVAPASLQTTVAMTFTVLNTNDSGADSLRQAIMDANANLGADTINFSIPGTAPHTINLLSALPAITEALTINGTSEPDFLGSPVIELNGVAAGVADGLTISTASCVIRGLVVNRFNGDGIAITGNGNIVEGNFIGTNVLGSFALGNAEDGVFISAGSANTIGGTTAAARNLLSGNRNGIHIFGGSTANQVRGNSIGTNAAGTLSLGNSVNGVLIVGSTGNAVGSVGTASSNTIAFNGAAGVAVASGTGNSIQSNSIFFNGGLGIDLGATGVTPNDGGDPDLGANNLQNFPVITSASAAGPSTTIQGALNSSPSTTFRIEFFSSQFPNPSGFGEGQTFVGAINATTDAAGNAAFNQTFPVTVPPGHVVAATATDPAGNTSEFSGVVQVGGVSGGVGADLSVLVGVVPNPVLTGTNVTKTISVTNIGPGPATDVTVTDVLSANTTFVSCNSTGGGVCGGTGNNRTITFASLAPGSGAVISIVASVNCSTANGTNIGNTAMVFSPVTPDPNNANNISSATTVANNPSPTIACPGNITTSNDSGKCTATVVYPTPLSTDNCPGTTVACVPPSGSSFAIGTTTVTCVATDAGGATATCSFTVAVTDTQPVAIVCPPNLVVTALPGNCTPLVSFPAPTVIDNCPGASVVCTPPSNSLFPVGTTVVNCTATSQGGGTASCAFTVTVIAPALADLVIEGDGPALEFGPITAKRKSRKIKKQPGRNFTVENVGCVPFVLSLESIRRVGRDVDNGRITDDDDQKLFSVNLVATDGSLTKLEILKHVILDPGDKLKFRVLFNPVIPAVTGETRGLSAIQVIPNLITSLVTFRLDDGSALFIPLEARVDTAFKFIHPNNPRRSPLIVFQRSGNEFVIEYSIHDSNLDVRRATYQFFDRNRRPVESEIGVNLAPVLDSRDLTRGQSFTIVQRVTGASDHPNIVGVQITVFDGSSSQPISSNGASSPLASSSTPSELSVSAALPASPSELTLGRSAGGPKVLSGRRSISPAKEGGTR